MDKYSLFLGFLEGTQANERNDVVAKAHQAITSGNSTYIWPAGQMGRLFYERFKEAGYNNMYLVDSNPQTKNAISPNDITDAQNSVLIIATLKHANIITAAAAEIGLSDSVMYYESVALLPEHLQDFPDDFYISTFIMLKEHLLGNKERYIAMYNALDDELSKERFIDNMLFRLTGDMEYTFPWDESLPQYFNSLVPKFDEESVIIDAGGYTGDTLEVFLQNNSRFKAYYLFEPDSELLAKAKTVSADKRITYICKGLSDTVGEASFMTDGGMGGSITENGNVTISLSTIDAEVKDKVTFIKMDIEGAELSALKGSRKTIIDDKPILAISLYHKASDYLDIFEFILSCNPHYKFYIRHHLDYYAETVLYAINGGNASERI